MSLVRDAASNALEGELLGGLLDVQVKIKKHQKKKEKARRQTFPGRPASAISPLFFLEEGEETLFSPSLSSVRSLMEPPTLGAGDEGYGGGGCGVSGTLAATAVESESRGGDRAGRGGRGGIADDGRGKRERARFASAEAGAAAADPPGRGFWDHSAAAELYGVLQQRSQRQGVSF